MGKKRKTINFVKKNARKNRKRRIVWMDLSASSFDDEDVVFTEDWQQFPLPTISFQPEDLNSVRNPNGWLVLVDQSQYLSASHSMSCKRYPYACRGNQALAMGVMAIATSASEEAWRWCNRTLDSVLDSGNMLYEDSYLHYKPKKTPILGIDQILRKFYTPGNCVCRVVVFKPRQTGDVTSDFTNDLRQFFREETKGVFVVHGGEYAVALFKTPQGYLMFDPGDCDRYGREVPPFLRGKARACLSKYPNVQLLADKLKGNVPSQSSKPRPAETPILRRSLSVVSIDNFNKLKEGEVTKVEEKIETAPVVPVTGINEEEKDKIAPAVPPTDIKEGEKDKTAPVEPVTGQNEQEKTMPLTDKKADSKTTLADGPGEKKLTLTEKMKASMDKAKAALRESAEKTKAILEKKSSQVHFDLIEKLLGHEKKVKPSDEGRYAIYGMEVTSLRRLNRDEI